jgi:hypothetical protein
MHNTVPGACRQRLSLWGDLVHLSPEFAAKAPEVMLHQERQIVAPLSQGREVDGEHT